MRLAEPVPTPDTSCVSAVCDSATGLPVLPWDFSGTGRVGSYCGSRPPVFAARIIPHAAACPGAKLCHAKVFAGGVLRPFRAFMGLVATVPPGDARG